MKHKNISPEHEQNSIYMKTNKLNNDYMYFITPAIRRKTKLLDYY